MERNKREGKKPMREEKRGKDNEEGGQTGMREAERRGRVCGQGRSAYWW